jgi:hypothetical protein
VQALQIGRFHALGQFVVLYQVWSTPTVIGLDEVPAQLQVIGKFEYVQTSQPLSINVSPATGAWLPFQVAMPGRCAQEVVLERPSFESEPALIEM